MTKYQRQKFYNAVRGKKIRWSGWDTIGWQGYVIAENFTNGYINGSFHSRYPGEKTWTNAEFSVNEGFQPVTYGYKWYIVQEKTSHLPDFL